jgi:hypothetical protein
MRVIFFSVILAACIPDTTGGSSSGSSGSSGIVADGASSEGGDASTITPERAALCATYASDTASCCQASPGTCPSNNADYWKQACEKYAASCPAMPTCFSGNDCNTLIYCGGGC